MPEEIKFRPDALPLNRRHLFATGLSAVIGSMVWPSYLVGREALITPLWARILRASIAAANDDSLDSRVVAEARHILQTVRYTHYQHHTHIDPATGTYDCDCSEFIGYVLEQIAPANYALIPKEEHQPRPRPFKYYEHFHSLPDNSPGWHPIRKITSVRPGDIIAWRVPDIEKDEDTGHVMIVAAKPEPRGPGLVTVRVYDSSVLPHVDDTRGDNKGDYRSGVGEGCIVFRVDSDGRPIAFQFRPLDHFHEDPIAIGRIYPLA
jgi:hypothetical protein